MSDQGARGSGYVWGQDINLQTQSFIHRSLYRTEFATVTYGPVALSRPLCYPAQPNFPQMGHTTKRSAMLHSCIRTRWLCHHGPRLISSPTVCHTGLPPFSPLPLSPPLYISLSLLTLPTLPPTIINCTGLSILRCVLCRRLGLYSRGPVVSLPFDSWSHLQTRRST